MTTFLVLLAGYVLSQFYRSFLAVIAPELSAELHLTATDLGNVSAAWFAAFAVSQFAVGIALDRYGPRRTVSAFMLSGAAGALLFAHAHSSSDAILAMALIGTGCAPALMGSLYVFARNNGAEKFALLSSAMIGLGAIGNLLGGTPLAFAQESIGWRSVFWWLAGFTLLSALLSGILVRDPPRVAEADHHASDRNSLGLGEILAIRPLWAVWPLMALAYGILITERGVWVGPYLSDVHALAPVARGHVIFLMAIAITLGALAYGPLEAWFGKRKPLAFLGSALTAAALAALSVFAQPSLMLATVLLCIVGFAGMTYGTVMAHVRSFLPEHILGRGLTFANFLCMAGAGLLQTFSGVYVDRLRASGLGMAQVYAHLHFALAVLLFVPTVIYFFSREKA